MADLIPKQKVRYPIWFRMFSSLAVFAFLASIVAYFGFGFLQSHEQQRTEDLQLQLAQGKLPQEIFSVKDGLEDFTQIVAARRDIAPFLTFVEENTHPAVSLSQFSVNAKLGTVTLSGNTSSFQSLEQQIQIFRENDLVQSMTLSSIGFGEEGNVSFGFDLGLLL